jgi:hypothetical protein
MSTSTLERHDTKPTKRPTKKPTSSSAGRGGARSTTYTLVGLLAALALPVLAGTIALFEKHPSGWAIGAALGSAIVACLITLSVYLLYVPVD